MEIFKIAGIAVISVVIITLLRQYNPGYALLVSVAASVMIVLYLVRMIAPVTEYFKSISTLASGADFKPVLKSVGIALLAQTAADICEDAGQKALAGKVLLAGKCGIVAAALPLFSALLQVLTQLLR